MTLHESIRARVPEAMREKDAVRLETLRAILSGITNELVATGKNPGDAMEDEAVRDVIRKLVKQRKDSVEQFSRAGRGDLVETETKQLAYLETFLPAPMDEDAIRQVVLETKEALGISEKGSAGVLVGAVMKKLSGQADGRVVKKIVETILV